MASINEQKTQKSAKRDPQSSSKQGQAERKPSTTNLKAAADTKAKARDAKTRLEQLRDQKLVNRQQSKL